MNHQIYEEATNWLIKHREGELDPQEKRAFDAWMRVSPQHVRAYLEMSAVWEEVPALDASWNPTPEELIERARADENVYPLEPMGRPPPVEETTRNADEDGRGGRRWFAFAATIVCALIGLAAWYSLGKKTYSTGVGEQRSIVLADGSTVELNSRSSVRVRYTDSQRRVDLLEGQALFRVAHNSVRPFIVHSGETNVRAVGTAFDVYRKRGGTVVTVVEGKVAVLASAPGTALTTPASERLPRGPAESAAPIDSPIFLAAGEQLTVPAAPSGEMAAIDSPQPADVAVATAWTHRTLVFEDSSLTEVAEEFNRYNTRQLILIDPAVADIHISGMFSSADPFLLLKFLKAQPELALEETETQIRVRRRVD